MNSMRKSQGFTLVEIAIVLVIIGLLLGGILKGQEMITQAKIKNSIADFSGVSAAYYGYQDRYRAIPGDDVNAATRWTTPTAATAGNGNGVVAPTTPAAQFARPRWRPAAGGIICAAQASSPAMACCSRPMHSLARSACRRATARAPTSCAPMVAPPVPASRGWSSARRTFPTR